jgi:hypothetical protein
MSETAINERISVLRASLALTTPLSFLPGDGTHRDIAIVSVRDAVGVPFYGEVAPLPGFSVEGIDDALAELDSIAFAIPPLEEASLPLPRPWNLLLNSIHCPSLRCALEGVILDRLARTGALTEIFRKRPSVECNGLILGGTEQETLREITTRTELGFRTLKIKISPDSIETTLRALRSSNLPLDDAPPRCQPLLHPIRVVRHSTRPRFPPD